MPHFPSIPDRSSTELCERGVARRFIERLRAKWMDAVGFALSACLLGALIQWLAEKADESAWDDVTATWEFPVWGLAALLVLFVVGHYFRARRDVFIAARDRANTAEASLVDAIAIRDERAAERDKLAAERDDALARAREAEAKTPQIGNVEKLYAEVKLPDNPAATAAAVRQLGLLGARFTTETAVPEPREIGPPPPHEPQASDQQADDHPDDVAEP
jgi:hypothetical protein